MKINHIIAPAFCVLLTACNSMYIKPNTLNPNEKIYATRGGYSMKRSIKERMEERGYNITVGKAKPTRTLSTSNEAIDSIDFDTSVIPENTRYVINVSERRETFMPYWCIFNGFWWWNFNVSIGDQETGAEIFTWRGRGCANSSLRKLDTALDELEIKQTDTEQHPGWTKRIQG